LRLRQPKYQIYGQRYKFLRTGVSQNKEEAKKWLRKAANQGYENAKQYLKNQNG